APVATPQSVVFGDFDGTLHFLSRAKAESQARLTTDGSPISVPTLFVGGLVIVVTRSGGLFAFRPA
ncbi:MAG: PQQ-binding-like beta-propeller repeat protein, partial [Caldimonas sp.]